MTYSAMAVLRDGALRRTESEHPVAGVDYLIFILYLLFRSVHGCGGARCEFYYKEIEGRGHAGGEYFSRSTVGHVSNVPGTDGTLETCPTGEWTMPLLSRLRERHLQPEWMDQADLDED